jgi:hypothetical protein
LKTLLPTVLVLSVLVASPTYAVKECACIAPPIQEAWSSSTIVFQGTVEWIRTPPPRRDRQELHTPGRPAVLVVRLTISEIFKGIESDTVSISVFTGHGPHDCAFPFEVGRSYVVFSVPSSFRGIPVHYSDSCLGTTVVGQPSDTPGLLTFLRELSGQE